MAGGTIVSDETAASYSFATQSWLSSTSPPSLPASTPINAVIFFGLCLVLGCASKQLLSRTRVPYTVTLLILGFFIGFLEYGTSLNLGKIGNGIRIWAGIDPDLLLAVFLPVLLFDSAFSMELEHIKGCMAHMLLLAVPGVVISTFCLGSALKLTFPYNWSWKISLLLGALLSATDPVAVLALLKELGGSKKLSTIIEGESMMNDGIAIVLYQLFLKMVLGEHTNAGAIICFLARNSFGAVGIGTAFGAATVLWFGFIFNDTVLETELTIAMSYVAYFTAQVGADVSGILTVMSLGMFCGIVAKIAFKGDGLQSLHHSWGLVASTANTVVFILSGVLIAEGLVGRDSDIQHHGNSWGYLILLYIFVQISRFVVVVVLYPFLRYFGSRVDWKEATVIAWSGLRGPVALSLALSFKRTSDSSSNISPETGTQFVFFSGGIVFLTLVLNGSTTQFFLDLLGMVKLSHTQKHLLEHTKREAMNKALETFGELGFSEELGRLYWSTIQKQISTFNNIEVKNVKPHSLLEANIDPHPENLINTRVFFLNGVQSAYREMLEKGSLLQATANILKKSVDEVKDLAAHEPLCDWKGLKANVHFPSYYRVLQASFWPQKLVTYITVEMLGSACCICAAFLCAHRVAQQKLVDLLGESDIASTVISESEAEGEDARAYLEEVRDAFPQVLHVVNTRQATHSVLDRLLNYFQNLEKVGLLEEPEMGRLHDAVQSDLKRLLRDPPLENMPNTTDLIIAHPLLGSLPSSIRESVMTSSLEIIKPHGVPLYEEGSNPDGVWFISKGVVKGRTESIRSEHSRDPSFIHDTTLGLYEVLVGRPYICKMITDTTVHGFFAESTKILSALKVGPAVEEFLWQESAIVLAKLLLPQVFGRMEMRDLRALVAESSIMTTHIRGETIELPHHQSVSILLEGTIKSSDIEEESVTSPAALLSPSGNHSFPGLLGMQKRESHNSASTSGTMAMISRPRYQVEARARVIMFDIGALEADRPENPRKQQKQSWKNMRSDGPGADSLAARALQLSIFGTLVDLPANGDGAATVKEDEEEEIAVRIDSGKDVSDRLLENDSLEELVSRPM